MGGGCKADICRPKIVITDKRMGKDGKFHFNYDVHPSNSDASNRANLEAQYPQLDISGYDLAHSCTFHGLETFCQ